MTKLPYIDDPVTFQLELKRIQLHRKSGKTKPPSRLRLKREDRKTIHDKTDGRCHVCGREVDADGFEADHIKSHSGGGLGIAANFLPACRTCNIYRWHYFPDEFQ